MIYKDPVIPKGGIFFPLGEGDQGGVYKLTTTQKHNQ